MFQEKSAISWEGFLWESSVWFQGILLWAVNITADILSGQTQSDAAVSWSTDVYPGDS